MAAKNRHRRKEKVQGAWERAEIAESGQRARHIRKILLRNSRLACLSRCTMPSIMKLPFPVLLCALVSWLPAQPAITIYNQGFGVVRERVSLDLKAGETAVTFVGATAQLEPDSVVLRDPTGRVQLRVLEQSYRADVMSQGVLLALIEGMEIDFLVRDQNSK
jgi:hypothetical protein